MTTMMFYGSGVVETKNWANRPKPEKAPGRRRDVSRQVATVILAVISVVFGVLGIVGVMGMVFALLPFAAPNGGYRTPLDWLVFVTIMAFSPTCMASILGSWAAHGKNRYGLAIAVSLLPLVPLGLLTVLFLRTASS